MTLMQRRLRIISNTVSRKMACFDTTGKASPLYVMSPMCNKKCGARPTLLHAITSRCTLALVASVDCGRPVIAASGSPRRLIIGRIRLIDFARIEMRDDHVSVEAHAEVAMSDLTRLHKEQRCAGASQG